MGKKAKRDTPRNKKENKINFYELGQITYPLDEWLNSKKLPLSLSKTIEQIVEDTSKNIQNIETSSLTNVERKFYGGIATSTNNFFSETELEWELCNKIIGDEITKRNANFDIISFVYLKSEQIDCKYINKQKKVVKTETTYKVSFLVIYQINE